MDQNIELGYEVITFKEETFTKEQINQAIKNSRSQINNDSADVIAFISKLKTELKLY